jgi:membrane associated rhomboid family serine protease
MGLYDRDYMRDDDSGYRPGRRARPWSPTIALLVVLVVVFLCQWLVPILTGRWLDPYFALSLDGIKHGFIWQLITFQFLHANFIHIALNGITLYSFGRILEQELGRGRFLLLYFFSGTAGGVLQVAASWLLPHMAEISVVGASAGIAGLLGAFILSFPEARLVLFPIPFKIRARTLLWFVLPLSIIGTVFPFGGIAHAAHLGGLLAGGAFIRWTWKTRHRVTPPPFLSKMAGPAITKSEAARDDFIAQEVDPILEKIATHGIHSLTERERKILETARRKMGRT